MLNLFSDPQGLHPEVEELATRATKLQHQLSSTATAVTTFLDSLQRVAERASTTTGAGLGKVLVTSKVNLPNG